MSALEKMRYRANAIGILFIVSPKSGKNKKIAVAAPRALRTGNFTIDSIVDSDALHNTTATIFLSKNILTKRVL